MRKSRLSLLGCVLIAPTAAYCADPMLWPEEGHFVAYPAETRTEKLELSVSGGLARDNNLFRLSDDTDASATVGSSDRSDTVRRVGVGLKANLPVSRQRFLIDANVDDYRFDRFGFLNYMGYKAGADWKWEVGNLWSGELGYARSRSLIDLAYLRSGTKDLITRDYGHVSAAYRLHPDWRVRGALEGNRYEHSDASRNILDNSTIAGTIGADYLTAAGNLLGGQLKVTEGNYPNRQVVATSQVDNQYREYEASGVIGWQFAPKTRLDGRLGYTNRRHNEVSARDFSGVTGRADLLYSPSAKVLLGLSGYREIRAVEDLVANYAVIRGASFGPAWAPTVKSVLQAKLIYEKRDFSGDPGFASGLAPQRQDTTRAARLAAGYKPWRNTEFTAAYERGNRSANIAGAAYDYNLFSLNAAISFYPW